MDCSQTASAQQLLQMCSITGCNFSSQDKTKERLTTGRLLHEVYENVFYINRFLMIFVY